MKSASAGNPSASRAKSRWLRGSGEGTRCVTASRHGIFRRECRKRQSECHLRRTSKGKKGLIHHLRTFISCTRHTNQEGFCKVNKFFKFNLRYECKLFSKFQKVGNGSEEARTGLSAGGRRSSDRRKAGGRLRERGKKLLRASERRS